MPRPSSAWSRRASGIAIVPSGTECIHLEGVVYQRLLEKNAVSALHLTYRESDEARYVRLLLGGLRAASKPSRRARRAPE